MNIAKLTSSALLTLSSLGLLAGPLSSPAHAGGPTTAYTNGQPTQSSCTNDAAACIAAWVAPVAPWGTFTVTGSVHDGSAPLIFIYIRNVRTGAALRKLTIPSVAMSGDYAGYSQFRTELPFRPGGGTLWGYRSDLEISASALVGGV